MAVSITLCDCGGGFGDVVGPVSAIDEALVLFDGITGKLIKDSGTVPTSGIKTFLATPSSANLAAAVTDETGSGSLVFGTSPTFVTPLLGTPTSGVLTNCTGLPIAGITGLGTGVATLLAATPSGTGGLAGTTSPTFTTGITLNGTFTQTSASASAIVSGPNGGMNPVFQVVSNVASQADGISITGNAAGSGVLFQALSSGSNAPISFAAKGSGGITFRGFSATANTVTLGDKVFVVNGGQGLFVDRINSYTGGGVFVLGSNFGLGTASPAYGLHGLWTTGLTANQTMLVQDATPTTGITGIFFSAGAAQSTNPILTVAGILKAAIFLSDGTVRFKGYTVATLPAGVVGDNAYVTDALAPTFLATVVGGGAIVTPVFYNGSAWVGA